MTWLLRLLGYIEEQPSIAAAQRARREATAMLQQVEFAEWCPEIAERMRRELAPPKPMRRRRK